MINISFSPNFNTIPIQFSSINLPPSFTPTSTRTTPHSSLSIFPSELSHPTNTKDGDDDDDEASLGGPLSYHHHLSPARGGAGAVFGPDRHHQNPEKGGRIHHPHSPPQDHPSRQSDQLTALELQQWHDLFRSHRQRLRFPETRLPQLPQRPAEERAHSVPHDTLFRRHLKFRHFEQPSEDAGRRRPRQAGVERDEFGKPGEHDDGDCEYHRGWHCVF